MAYTKFLALQPWIFKWNLHRILQAVILSVFTVSLSIRALSVGRALSLRLEWEEWSIVKRVPKYLKPMTTQAAEQRETISW